MPAEKESSQHQKFVTGARSLGCDMTQEEFTETLKGLATVKPMTNKQVKKKAASRKKNGPN